MNGHVSMDAYVSRRYASINLVLKVILALHMVMQWCHYFLERGIPKILFRFFSFLNYCDIYRNANEEINLYEKRPTYAALAIWSIKIVHAYHRLLLTKINEEGPFNSRQAYFLENVYNNKDFIFSETPDAFVLAN